MLSDTLTKIFLAYKRTSMCEKSLDRKYPVVRLSRRYDYKGDRKNFLALRVIHSARYTEDRRESSTAGRERADAHRGVSISGGHSR